LLLARRCALAFAHPAIASGLFVPNCRRGPTRGSVAQRRACVAACPRQLLRGPVAVLRCLLTGSGGGVDLNHRAHPFQTVSCGRPACGRPSRPLFFGLVSDCQYPSWRGRSGTHVAQDLTDLASSSRSQITARTASAAASLTWEQPSSSSSGVCCWLWRLLLTWFLGRSRAGFVSCCCATSPRFSGRECNGRLYSSVARPYAGAAIHRTGTLHARARQDGAMMRGAMRV
jgi:hypothetical protein